jgi:hypothetical protein
MPRAMRDGSSFSRTKRMGRGCCMAAGRSREWGSAKVAAMTPAAELGGGKARARARGRPVAFYRRHSLRLEQQGDEGDPAGASGCGRRRWRVAREGPGAVRTATRHGATQAPRQFLDCVQPRDARAAWDSTAGVGRTRKSMEVRVPRGALWRGSAASRLDVAVPDFV